MSVVAFSTSAVAAARYFVPDAPQDHRARAAFRDAMQRVVAASVKDFTALDSGKAAAREPGDDPSDEFHKLNMFVPIFSKCRIDIPWHHSGMLVCETQPNHDLRAVQVRFDQMVSDIESVAGGRPEDLDTHPDCGGGECRERVFSTNLPRGDLRLVLHSAQTGSRAYQYITLQAGNA